MQTTRREFKNERSLWNGEREPHNLTPLMESGFDGSIIFRVLPLRLFFLRSVIIIVLIVIFSFLI